MEGVDFVRIEIPDRLNRNSLSLLLNQVVTLDGEPLHESYELDFSNCKKFIEPIGVAFINNLIEWLLSKEIKVEIEYSDLSESDVWEDEKKSPQRFLDDCGFFEKFFEKKIHPLSSLRETTVPLTDVRMNNFNQWLDTDFIPWMGNAINKEPVELATFKVCIEEIFNNVRDHAQQNSSCVFAQHFPANNQLIISIADIGQGIINHIKSKPNYQHFTDEEALLSSVQRQFTTKSTPKNRGVGLDTLINNIVMNAGGCVYIFANSGILNCSANDDGDGIQKTYIPARHYYPGTHIEIHIDISKAENLFDVVEEEFDWDTIM